MLTEAAQWVILSERPSLFGIDAISEHIGCDLSISDQQCVFLSVEFQVLALRLTFSTTDQGDTVSGSETDVNDILLRYI